MNKIYAQVPATNPPQHKAVYPTDKGELAFDPSTKQWENGNSPQWWMQEVSLSPVTSSIPGKYKNNWEHWFITRDENGKVKWL